MNQSNYQYYYTNDRNQLMRKERDYIIHRQKLQDIRNCKTPVIQEQKQLYKNKQQLQNGQILSDLMCRNKQLADNIAQIHSRPIINANAQVRKRTNSLNKHGQAQQQILEENFKLCKRLISQESVIDFKHNLTSYKELSTVKARLRKIKKQLEMQNYLQMAGDNTAPIKQCRSVSNYY